MANINAPDLAYFDSFATEILGKFNRIKHLINHNPSKGDYHEEVLRSIIRNFLTKRFSVKKGFIFKNDTEKSKQLDIMIIDENIPAAYIFQEGEFAIVIPEAVVAIVEVKTVLDASQFDEAVTNIAEAKKIWSSITGIIFGFAGTEPSDSTLDSWFKRVGVSNLTENKHLGPNAILFFEHGCMLTKHDSTGVMKWSGDYYHKLFQTRPEDAISVKDAGWHLSIALAMLVSSCEASDSRQMHRFEDSKADRLIQSENAARSHSRFSFGEGLSYI